MTPEDFAGCIQREVIKENMRSYNDLFVMPLDQIRDWRLAQGRECVCNYERGTARSSSTTGVRPWWTLHRTSLASWMEARFFGIIARSFSSSTARAPTRSTAYCRTIFLRAWRTLHSERKCWKPPLRVNPISNAAGLGITIQGVLQGVRPVLKQAYSPSESLAQNVETKSVRIYTALACLEAVQTDQIVVMHMK